MDFRDAIEKIEKQSFNRLPRSYSDCHKNFVMLRFLVMTMVLYIETVIAMDFRDAIEKIEKQSFNHLPMSYIDCHKNFTMLRFFAMTIVLYIETVIAMDFRDGISKIEKQSFNQCIQVKEMKLSSLIPVFDRIPTSKAWSE